MITPTKDCVTKVGVGVAVGLIVILTVGFLRRDKIA